MRPLSDAKLNPKSRANGCHGRSTTIVRHSRRRPPRANPNHLPPRTSGRRRLACLVRLYADGGRRTAGQRRAEKPKSPIAKNRSEISRICREQWLRTTAYKRVCLGLLDVFFDRRKIQKSLPRMWARPVTSIRRSPKRLLSVGHESTTTGKPCDRTIFHDS